MRPPAVVADIAVAASGWAKVCPRLRPLVRETARLAVARGMTATGIAGARRVELGITLLDDAEQARLNRRYRGKEGATNVLSFPAAAGAAGTSDLPRAPLLLGDVVLAFETTLREAREQQKPFADHLRHLLVHGVLHLLGCDHEKEPAALAMESLETEILAELGVPDPYRRTMSSRSAPTYPNERDRAAGR